MLTENWKELADKAVDIYEESVKKTLELFPFEDPKTLEVFNSLPSARGKTVTDFGNPAKVPIEVYLESLPDKVKEITEKDPAELLKELKRGTYSVLEVLESYFHAALFASKLVNCVYEFLPVEALAFAKALDAAFDESKDLPLYGLPISIKEMIPFKNRPITHGSLCYLDRVVDYDAEIVKILLAKGAFPFVRTTNPQSLMMLECESYMHGRTVNPFNSDLTCGGSSGGEGAINGIHASTVGLGSDIGGSIRCPAAFNGIWGMRSTVGRLPCADYFSCQLGSESILSVTGPLTRSLDLLEITMKSIIDSKPWLVDPMCTAIPWKPVEFNKKIRIGILHTDEVVTPLPPVARALKEVESKLLNLVNVELVEFKPFEHQKAMEIISSLYFEDGGADTKSTLTATGEPMCEQTSWVLSKDAVKPLAVPEIWKWNLAKQAYRKAYLKHWLSYNDAEGGELDAVIAPVFPGVAAKHRTAKYWGYTAQWNLLDYPVLVFPAGKIDTSLDKPDTSYKPLNDMDKFVYETYDSAESFAGAPVNLGLVGLRNTEEKLIEIGKILRDL
ncbi:amidase activity protein [Scheffersomyces xylosifermentans]|uniref:amidase activity protein n=1 Tax=Scheffersomyces xylosifermentans TaxID=1304137 RepID=UPI00315D4F7F